MKSYRLILLTKSLLQLLAKWDFFWVGTLRNSSDVACVGKLKVFFISIVIAIAREKHICYKYFIKGDIVGESC